jgi:organic radical activating enzyme
MHEVYKPTLSDRQRLIVRPDTLKVSGDKAFATLQGEGVTTGKPAVFIRLQFCNLACGKIEGWQCDTGYTWDKDREEFWKEPEDWSYQEATDNIINAWIEKFGDTDDKRVVITGGEPLIQQDKLIKLVERLPDWNIEIETNGTIKPSPDLSNCQFNCSPKLNNSGNSVNRRYKPEVLTYINSLPNSWFKFVVNSPQDFREINSIVEECGLSSEKILIMPEGLTAEVVEKHAREISPEISRRGWNITYRNQLIWFGPKRRT